MRKSTNFDLNLVEGNDLVNPLVQDVPNYEAIDEQMYKNECNSIGIATELKSGTVHALTRTIPNAPMFRFKATSNFTAGDTFTVDGIQVSALTPSGDTLASGCYIVGSEVLCVLRETLLTVYVSGGEVVTAQDSEKLGGQLPEYYGTAENVSSALSTAQSANQLTLSLQQTVSNMNNNLEEQIHNLSKFVYYPQASEYELVTTENVENSRRTITISNDGFVNLALGNKATSNWCLVNINDVRVASLYSNGGWQQISVNAFVRKGDTLLLDSKAVGASVSAQIYKFI